jgi:hypothetical protein
MATRTIDLWKAVMKRDHQPQAELLANPLDPAC